MNDDDRKDETPGSSEDTVDTEDSGSVNPEALAPKGKPGLPVDLDEPLAGLMNTNFIEFASYVVKDRAIPDLYDGLKPVQRRILHTLWVMDDGRFHKVANVIGQAMQYHPHGDRSIGDALVVLANKECFLDRQGNFGNIHTGDVAAAARYIECRLSPLAREVLFNAEITPFIDSYDGRNREPVALPAKIPTVLLLGAEGIAVTLATSILPHNFNELIDAQIAILEGRPFSCHPDFLTGGIMDVSGYDDGRGKVRVRARIEVADDKTLVIREVPATVTTERLMDSIEDAVKRNKIKIAAINDYTAEQVEIEIKLPRGTHADEVVRQLYAYTKCEVALTSNIVVIDDNRPREMTVSEILNRVTERLVDNLGRELEIELQKLQEKFHEKTLAQLFIENRIYKRIEECETDDLVRQAVFDGLTPYRHLLPRDITREDVDRLLELKIRRISRFDIEANRRDLDEILVKLEQTWKHLRNLVSYTTHYLRQLKSKYGAAFPRHTVIEEFERVNVREVALQNLKVYHDRVSQFVGSAVKASNKDAEPLACTEFDRLVLLRSDGVVKVIPVQEKAFVGPIKYLFKADKMQVFSMLYREKRTGKWYAKRFRIGSYILEKEYATIPKGCVVEAVYTTYGVVAQLALADTARSKGQSVEVDFNVVELRSLGARGFKVTERDIAGITLLKRGSEEPPEGLQALLSSNKPEADEPEPEEDEGEEDLSAEEAESASENLPADLIHKLAQHWRSRADEVIGGIRQFLPNKSDKAAKPPPAAEAPAPKPAAPAAPPAEEAKPRRPGRPRKEEAKKPEPPPPPPEPDPVPEKPARGKRKTAKGTPAAAGAEKKPATPPPGLPKLKPRKLIDEDGDFFLS